METTVTKNIVTRGELGPMTSTVTCRGSHKKRPVEEDMKRHVFVVEIGLSRKYLHGETMCEGAMTMNKSEAKELLSALQYVLDEQ